MKEPAVSVLMTVYNRESYVASAIESVLASDFSDFELIISDDASTDRSVEICRRYVYSDSRIRLFVNEVNLGDYPNRNKAASCARGKYLKYVDSDDIIYPWSLGVMVKIMDRFPHAGWGLCSMEPNAQKTFPFVLSSSEAFRYHYFGSGLFQRSPLSSIIRKDLFEKVGGFLPLRMVGDFDMWHRLAIDSAVVLMPQGMVWYRSHAQQEIRDYFKYLPDYEKIKLTHLRSPKCPLVAAERAAIIRAGKLQILKHLAACLKRLKLIESVIVFRTYLKYLQSIK